MAVLIYVLCAMTALVCAVLLLLGSRRAGSRMLFWSGLCFAGLAFNQEMLEYSSHGDRRHAGGNTLNCQAEAHDARVVVAAA